MELIRLPSALFEVTKLHVLVLRESAYYLADSGNNHLAELPSAIGALHHLKELNISGNQLVCLG